MTVFYRFADFSEPSFRRVDSSSWSFVSSSSCSVIVAGPSVPTSRPSKPFGSSSVHRLEPMSFDPFARALTSERSATLLRPGDYSIALPASSFFRFVSILPRSRELTLSICGSVSD